MTRRVCGLAAAMAVWVGVSSTSAQAGEAPATKVFVRWSTFTPQVIAPGASLTTRTTAARARLQGQLQSVVPGSWVGRTYAHVGWSVVAIPAAQKASALQKLQRAFGSSNVEAIHTRHLYKTPNDPSYSSQWWLNKIGAPAAWDTTTGSSSVVVAVLDSGISLSHPDLVPNIYKNTKEIPNNGKDDDGNGYVDDVNGYNAIEPGTPPQDDSFAWHGTHVSGIIGAVGNNRQQTTGINWSVKILPIKVFDSSETFDDATIVQGIEYVLALKAKGVNIRATNDSWGNEQASQVLHDAFAALDSAGILNFVAAGNKNSSIDTNSDYPADYTYPTIVSVGASDQSDKPADFSNYGAKNVDIFAPGVDILSLSGQNGTASIEGTSMSTAEVTGAAALLWSLKPSLTAAQIKATLLNTATRLPDLKGKCVSNGRLDLGAAVASLAGTPTPTPKPTNTPRPTATPTPRPTSTPKPTATPRPTATPVPTATPKPTGTPVPTNTFTVWGYTYYTQNNAKVPVAGVSIYLDRTLVTSSASNGAFSIPGVAPGSHLLSAALNGYSFSAVTATLSGTARDVRFDIPGTPPAKRYSIMGTVRDANGKALGNVSITMNSKAVPVAKTNSSGRFELDNYAQGTYKISATINGAGVAVNVSLPATSGVSAPNADIVLQPVNATTSGSNSFS